MRDSFYKYQARVIKGKTPMKSIHNVVLIGYGYWGPNIAKNLARCKGLNLYGICDSDASKLEKAKALYGDNARYYTDYNDVINDENVGACAVALRNDIAQIVARAILRSGRHLFMEKPMAVKMEDALLLKQLAEEKKLILHVDHIMVYNPFVRYIKQMIDNGELGDIISFESNRSNLGPFIKQDMNVMWDLAVHDLAVIDYLCGSKEAVQVECVGEKYYGDQEIITYLSIKYGGFIAMVKSSWFSPLKERSIIISGTKKMVVFDDLKESEKLTIYDKGVEFDSSMFKEYGQYEAKVRLGDLYIPYIEQEDALLNGLNQFAECINSGVPSPTGAGQAIRVLTILKTADEKLKEQAE